MTRAVVAAALLALVLAAGCGGEEADVEADGHTDGEHALEHQRTQVRALTADLVRLAAAGLGGAPRGARGRWRGCESVFPEGYRSYRYDADGRVDAGPRARRPYLDALRPALERAGFDVGEKRPGPADGTSLRVSREGLSASISEVPTQGDYLVVRVAGPCVEVPAADREAWLNREEPEPSIL